MVLLHSVIVGVVTILRSMVVTLVDLDLAIVRVGNGQVTEGELADRFGVMCREHQAEVIDARRCRRSRWQGLGHLAMDVATEDERDRLTSRMTFPVHVQAGQILRIEAQLDAPTNQRLVDGVPITSQRDRSGAGDAAHDRPAEGFAE